MAIEDLAVGDRVLTAEGRLGRSSGWVVARSIAVIIRRRVGSGRCAWRRTPSGRSMPGRPLFLAPDHAVFVDDALSPVRHLIDGGAIRQVERGVVTYWHLELESHDVVLAEGLPGGEFSG